MTLSQPGRVDPRLLVHESKYLRIKTGIQGPTQGVASFVFTGVVNGSHLETPFDPHVTGTDARIYRVNVTGIEQEILYHVGLIGQVIGVPQFPGPCREGMFSFSSKKPVGDGGEFVVPLFSCIYLLTVLRGRVRVA